MLLQLLTLGGASVFILYFLYCIISIQKMKKKSLTLKKQLAEELVTQQKLKKEIDVLQLELSQNALTDSLTGLPSRKLFQDHLQLVLNQSIRHQLTFCVMCLDLAEFNKINEIFGYDRGDEILKKVAERLQSCIRQVDTLCHFGRDEFVFIFTQINKSETAVYIAQRLLNALSQPISVQGQEFYVTGSVGVAVYPMDGKDAKTLLKNANSALNQAKLHGHNTYQFFREEMHKLSERELLLSSCLHNEATFQKFSVLYQPRMNVDTKKIESMQAILQWQHSEMGLIKFDEIFRLAEKNNQIAAINEWLLSRACHDLVQWNKQEFNPESISIPISLKQLENSHFIQKVTTILQETHLDPKKLIFEINESSLLIKYEAVEKMLHMMNHLGVRIAVSNFGAAQLQLQHLRHLPIHIFKIDHNLIFDMTTNKESEALVQTIISLAKSLQYEVVAEGVETEEQKKILQNLGCSIMQGMLFSCPALPSEFTAKMSLL